MATSAFSGSTLAAGEAGPSDWQNPSVAAMMHRLEGSSGHFVLVIVVTLLLISFTTRFYTSTYPGVKTSGSDGAKRVKMLPYWFPIIGHIFPLAFDPNKYMLGLKEKSSEGIIALNLGGTTHNIVFSPSIAKETFQQRSSHLNYSTIVWSVLHRVFGASLKMRHVYDKWLSEMNRLTMNTLLHGPHFATMVEETMRHMNEAIPNLVSFNHSLIDQSLWERVSHVALVETDDEDSQNGPVAEVNLFILLRDLMSHVAIPALMGSAFLEVFPTALQDMWELDNGFRWLSSGLPLWLPIPPLTRAHIARSRLKRAFAAYGRALDKFEAGIDPGPEWRDLDDVSALMKRRHSIWKESGLSPEARAPVDSTLLWAMNTNANPFCFWLLLRILADPNDLVSRIRAETAPYVNASQPTSTFSGISEPPRLRLSADKLVSSCPLFRSCYFEALRLDSAPWSLKYVDKDFVLPAPKQRPTDGHDGASVIRNLDHDANKTSSQAPAPGFQLQAGGFVTIPHSAHHMDPDYYASPETFIPERFLVPASTATATATTTAAGTETKTPPPSSEKEQPKMRVDIGSLRPYGGGEGLCKGRNLAERECLAMVAGILALWDFEPVPAANKGTKKKGTEKEKEKTWRIPKHQNGNSVFKPVGDLRVRVRRRKLVPTPSGE